MGQCQKILGVEILKDLFDRVGRWVGLFLSSNPLILAICLSMEFLNFFWSL